MTESIRLSEASIYPPVQLTMNRIRENKTEVVLDQPVYLTRKGTVRVHVFNCLPIRYGHRKGFRENNWTKELAVTHEKFSIQR